MVLAAVAASGAQPPDTLEVREILVAECGDWYRSASSVDAVEAAIVRGDPVAPREGDPVAGGEGAEGARWRRAVADSNGWIELPELTRGWAFARVPSETDRILILEGFGYRCAVWNGERRAGNVYGFKDSWEAWEPRFDASRVPVRVRAGVNEFLLQGSRAGVVKARLVPPPGDVFLNGRDVTFPDLVLGAAMEEGWAAVALVNATGEWLRDATIEARLGGGEPVRTELAALPPLTSKKVPFRFRAPAQAGDEAVLAVEVVAGTAGPTRLLDAASFTLAVVAANANRRVTFPSAIDGSVQYYGLLPASGEVEPGDAALVLSLHGAAVEARNQSGSYHPKSWAHIVAPTNRGPYGYNWEDWGRLDALEALEHASRALGTDPARVMLTGHSMGGHGVWHLGALHPDRFAALGPSAGWLSFWSYRPERPVPPRDSVEAVLARATLPSRTLELAENYADLGVYVLHGVDDDNVPVEQARTMVRRLQEFHRDFVVHEQPAAGHWWDASDEPGTDCVDWPPMFDFFARRVRPSFETVREVRFITPNPGVSATRAWVTIAAQERALLPSSVELRVDPARRRISGRTANVARLVLDVTVLEGAGPVTLAIDGTMRAVEAAGPRLHLHRRGTSWHAGPPAPASHKGPHRAGTFKDAFRNRVVFVVGTAGDDAENAAALANARFDAERFGYDGNGAIDVVRDTDFDPSREIDRNVVLYGNATTNRAWRALLRGSPVQVTRGEARVGRRRFRGPDVAVLFVRPRPGSDRATVGAVAGTGVPGLRLGGGRPYLSPGFAYPDVTVLRAPEREDADRAAIFAGWFGNDWSLEQGEFVAR